MRRAQHGFTLIEVVVAFVMLCLVLSVGFEIFSTGMSRASELGDRSRALGIAQSQLAVAGTETELKEGRTQGETPDRRFQWATTITPTEEGFDPKNPPNTVYMLFRIDTVVGWQSTTGRAQQLALSTLALGQRPQ
jgi:general secretion pathway protein I